MRSRKEITTQPLKEPVRINVVLEKDDLSQLKMKALYNETTVNEIVRSLIADYLQREKEHMEKRIFFKIFYGIKSFNSDGSEKPYDTAESGALYTKIESAIENQKIWFDGMCEEMRRHNPQRRKTEQAFCYIQAISGVSDDTPDGEDAFDLLDEDTKKRLNAADLTMYGRDIVEHW